jgi:hypothetical protein
VTQSIVELAANDTEKEEARHAKKVLQEIARAAVHAEGSKAKKAEAASPSKINEAQRRR